MFLVSVEEAVNTILFSPDVSPADLLPLKPRTRSLWLNFRAGTHATFKETSRARHLAWSRRLKRRARCADDVAALLPTPDVVNVYVPSDRYRFSSERGR